MANWRKTIKIKHLLTDHEDHESVQKSMIAIAEVLKNHNEFECLDYDMFYDIPKDDLWCSPVEAGNKLLEEVYDIADAEKIWIG